MPSDAGPPVPRRDDTVRSLHGVDRPDPYAWMRAVDSDEVLAHLQAERASYDAAVAHRAPSVQALVEAMLALVPPTERGVAVDRSRCVYYTYRAQGREHGEIRRVPRASGATSSADVVVTDENAGQVGELVLDIDALDDGSGYVDVGVQEPSPDEELLAYAVDVIGDERYALRFRDLQTGRDLPDVVEPVYVTGAWSTAGDAFWYTVPDGSGRPYEVRLHVLGTDPSSDTVVLTEPDEQYEVTVHGCRSGRLVVVTSENRDTTEVWLLDPAAPDVAARCVEPRRRGLEYRVEHAPHGDTDRLLVVTNLDWPEFRLMTAPTAEPGLSSWQPYGVADDAERIESVDAFAHFVVVSLRRRGRPQLRVLTHDGSASKEILPPTAGHVRLAETPRWDADRLVVEFQSHVLPRTWFDVDPWASGDDRERHRQVVPNHQPERYESVVRQIEARDGALVPVTVVRRRDVPLDGSAPCLLYGYGAYEAIFEPEFDPAIVALLDRGVVYAHAQIRGGGELGRHWYLDGRLEHKHHTFDDHVDVALGLGRGLVDPARIVSRGLSAGGLLQGAVFSRRPDVWRGVVAEVPFVDVVTTMLDPTIALTANEWDEWGDPRRAADFGWMLAYSPYDNVPPPGGRPDLLVTGAVHDARVMVWEPAKWVAALRHSDPDWADHCLFRVDTGHGAHTGPSGRLASLRYEAEVCDWILARLT